MNWYREISSVTEEVECGGAAHRIRWHRGSLAALDHDVDAERAVASLGGDLPDCVQILDAWRAGREDSELASVLLDDYEVPRETAILLNIQNLQSAVASLLTQLSSGHAMVQRMQREIQLNQTRLYLISLPGRLKERLELELAVRCERRWGSDEMPAATKTAVEALVASRANPEVEQCMRTWRRIPSRSIITVETWVIDPGEEPTLIGWFGPHGGFAAASLPISWLRRVWARGLSLVDGCFILDVEESESVYKKVTAARWEHQRKEIGDKSTPVVGEALLVTRKSGTSLRWLEA